METLSNTEVLIVESLSASFVRIDLIGGLINCNVNRILYGVRVSLPEKTQILKLLALCAVSIAVLSSGLAFATDSPKE